MILPLILQLSATVALTANLGNTDHASRDREAFGVRYRTPAAAHFTAQAGLVTTNENGILHPGEGGGVRHWAVGVEWNGLAPWWRLSAIYGNFDERRNTDRELNGLVPLTYYRLFAVGNEFTFGAAGLTIEKLVNVPVITHAALHDVIVRFHSPPVDAMVQSMTHGSDQPSYHFVTAEATVRPAWRAPAPWKFVGIQGGTREVPSYTSDRAVPLTFVAAGLFISWSKP